MIAARACGMVVKIGELFGAESKSQVYGILDTFSMRIKKKQCSYFGRTFDAPMQSSSEVGGVGPT